MIMRGLHVRITAERVGLLAACVCGGAQLPSVVEGCVSAAARDLLFLLNGATLAASLPRDALKAAMALPLEAASHHSGIIFSAMTFLAGYGIMVTLSTDRYVGRILGALQLRLGSCAHQFFGPLDPSAYQTGVEFCRVGALANLIRHAVDRLGALGVERAHGGRPWSGWKF